MAMLPFDLNDHLRKQIVATMLKSIKMHFLKENSMKLTSQTITIKIASVSDIVQREVCPFFVFF